VSVFGSGGEMVTLPVAESPVAPPAIESGDEVSAPWTSQKLIAGYLQFVLKVIVTTSPDEHAGAFARYHMIAWRFAAPVELNWAFAHDTKLYVVPPWTILQADELTVLAAIHGIETMRHDPAAVDPVSVSVHVDRFDPEVSSSAVS
jgi:hypothetical protein